MKSKKFVCLLCIMLAVLMTAVCLPSCSGGGDEVVTTGSATTEGVEGDTASEHEIDRTYLPNASYNAADVTFLLQSGREEQFYLLSDNEADADIYQQAVHTRNCYVEEKYDVVLDFIIAYNRNEFHVECSAASMSGDCPYDIIISDYYYGLETAGYLSNLNTYNVINFENPYWVSGWNEKATVNNIIYSAVGYLNNDINSGAMVIFSNDYMAMDLGVADEIFADVKNGTWTLETMKTYMEKATVDLNDDGFDFKDKYGLGYDLWSGRAFLSSCGIQLADYNDGEVSFKILSQTNADTFDEVKEFLTAGNLSYYGGRTGYDQFDGPESNTQLFLQGRSLFLGRPMHFASQVNEQFEHFTIYPMPKRNTDQQEYITSLIGTCTQAILRGANDPEMSATILEAMNILSYLDTYPIYYDKLLKNRYQNSPETAALIDTIIGCIKIDFAFVHSAAFNNLADRPFDALDPKKATDIGGLGWYSGMGPVEKIANGQLENFLEHYKEEAAS